MTNKVASKQMNSPKVVMICVLFQMWRKYSCSKNHAEKMILTVKTIYK